MSKRWICMIVRHRYKVERPKPSRFEDDERGRVVRCQRCGHEKSMDGTPPPQWVSGKGR